MPRNEFYPYQKPYSQEESYLYGEYENYDYNQEASYSKPEHKPHHCCPPCPCPKPEPKPHCCCPPCPKPKPEPKPEPKHECKLISAQLSYDARQEVSENTALKFDTFDGVSNSNSNAPLYYANGIITFNKAGRFIVTYGTDIHFAFIPPVLNDAILALQLDGDTVAPSISHAEAIIGQNLTLNKTALINVTKGSKLKLIALQNDNTIFNGFRHTVLVIDEKCEMHKKCD